MTDDKVGNEKDMTYKKVGNAKDIAYDQESRKCEVHGL